MMHWLRQHAVGIVVCAGLYLCALVISMLFDFSTGRLKELSYPPDEY